MKKISWILLFPVVLNVITFTKRFLNDSIIMFFISFIVFFVSLYADFENNPKNQKRWCIITAVMVYVSVVLFAFNTGTLNHVLTAVIAFPAAAGTVIFHILGFRLPSGHSCIRRLN